MKNEFLGDNAYEVFGVSKDASDKEIKRAYTKMIREFTPEKDPEKFDFFRTMYERISDKYERAVHDAFVYHKKDFDTLFMLIDEAVENEDYENAIADARMILDVEPNFIYAKKVLADSLKGNGDYEEASMIYTELINLGYYTSLALYEVGECLLHLTQDNKYEVACGMWCTAYAMDTFSIDRMEKGIDLLYEEHKEEVVTLCKCFFELVPDEIDATNVIYTKALGVLAEEKEFEFINEIKTKLLEQKEADIELAADLFTCVAYHQLQKENFEIVYFLEELGYFINVSAYQKRLRENLELVKEFDYVTTNNIRQEEYSIWDVVREYVVVYGKFDLLDKNYIEEEKEALEEYFYRLANDELEVTLRELAVVEEHCKAIREKMHETIEMLYAQCRRREELEIGLEELKQDKEVDERLIDIFSMIYIATTREGGEEEIKKSLSEMMKDYPAGGVERMLTQLTVNHKNFTTKFEEELKKVLSYTFMYSFANQMKVGKKNENGATEFMNLMDMDNVKIDVQFGGDAKEFKGMKSMFAGQEVRRIKFDKNLEVVKDEYVTMPLDGEEEE